MSEMEAVDMAGSELKRLRTRAGMSQEDVARLVNVRGITIGRWERGSSPISLPVAAFLRTVLAKKGKAKS